MQLSKSVVLACALVLASTTGCASSLPPVKPVAHVDLPRFMGKWYVIATIPTRFEKDAYNPIETYTLQPDGRIETGFRFRSGAFDGKVKVIHSTGFVKPDSGNAVWGVQVFWPLKAQYIVAYLKDDYSQTIVARDARDYTWIMARTPSIPQADYDALM
ncbi:MAG: lipocalin family protein, partial [Rhodanobacter sp.]